MGEKKVSRVKDKRIKTRSWNPGTLYSKTQTHQYKPAAKDRLSVRAATKQGMRKLEKSTASATPLALNSILLPVHSQRSLQAKH